MRAVWFIGVIVGFALAARGDGFAFQADTPEAQGFDAAKLEAWRENLAQRGTKGLLLIRNDRVVVEWHAPDYAAEKTHYSASMAKALVGGMSLLVAMQDDRLKPDDPAAKYVPQWRGHPARSKITIAHLATHTSGVEDAEQDRIPHDQLAGWKGDFWKRTPDPFTISRDLAPVIFEPGTQYAYSNPGMAMLAYAVTGSLKGSAHEDIRTLLRERVMRPIGVPDREWSIGYGQTYEVDGLKLVANWGGGGFTPRATARVGRLMLRKGDWDGKRILDSAWVDRALQYDQAARPGREKEPSPTPGLGWWTNLGGTWKNVPRDAFGGGGAGNQHLIVIPSLNLICVRNGANLFDARAGETFWGGAEKHLLNPLMAAVVDPPVKASRAIRSIEFAPISSVKRDAAGSDNWPVTWGDDGHLYTSYGDGWGFNPRTEKKLSMGFARIEGGPADIRGVNIRTESGESVGDGAKGSKASGMLMVDGVLYAWVRNTGNATLARSEDRGKTWTFGFKLSQSFATPTFVNYGKNYEGARDEYVYWLSQDGDIAYEPADGVVLARVNKDRIRERSGWEFYSGVENGKPLWSNRVEDRKPVLTYPGHCERTDVSYNPALKRYFMTLGFGHGKGWGIFDAPEPWGPWSVAFHTREWDIADTHGYRLPTKWISEDGRTMWLIYSGLKEDDALCVRRMTVDVYPGER